MDHRATFQRMLMILTTCPVLAIAQEATKSATPSAAAPKAAEVKKPPDEADRLAESGWAASREKRYDEAEKSFRSALAIREKSAGPENPDTAIALKNLGMTLLMRDKQREGLPLYQRALAIQEKVLGPEHPKTAETVAQLALFRIKSGNYAEAFRDFRRALDIQSKALGPKHPDTLKTMSDCAALFVAVERRKAGFFKTGSYDFPERVYSQILVTQEKDPRTNQLSLANTLNNLAGIYAFEKRYEEAEPLMKRALAIREKRLGPDDLEIADTIDMYVALLGKHRWDSKVKAEARALSARSRAIRAKHPEKPSA